MIEALTRRTLYALLAVFSLGLSIVTLAYGLEFFSTKDQGSLAALAGAPCYLYITGACIKATLKSKERFGFRYNPQTPDAKDKDNEH